MRDRVVAREPELHPPRTHTVLDWMLRGSFNCLTFALNTLPIAVVYATWSGLGIFLITLLGYAFFEEALDWRAFLGLVLIVAGVVLVNSFAPNNASSSSTLG